MPQQICPTIFGLACDPPSVTASSLLRRGFKPFRLSAFHNVVRPEYAGRELGNLLPLMPANAVQGPLASLPVECKWW